MVQVTSFTRASFAENGRCANEAAIAGSARVVVVSITPLSSSEAGTQMSLHTPRSMVVWTVTGAPLSGTLIRSGNTT